MGSPLLRSYRVKGWRQLAIIVVVTGGLIVGALSDVTHADESALPAALSSYPTGKITAVYQAAFQIDGRTVSLAPEAVLVDRHGDPLQITALMADIDVKYHIQKGTTDKIDWMLLILPE